MKRSVAWRHWRSLGVSVISVLFLIGAIAQSATITVLSPEDGGPGTLRQAIFDALPGDTINFAIPGTAPYKIGLTSEELLINKDLTIDGPGREVLYVDGGGHRVFHIEFGSVTATISGLTITNGFTQTKEDGAGILNAGSLTINNCAIRDCGSNGKGGGIANTGTLTIANSTVSGNTAAGLGYGGGIANLSGATLTITNSTVSGNVIDADESYGGGIANSGALTISNSTISGNQTNQFGLPGGVQGGGGIANFNGATLTIENSTISGNSNHSFLATGVGVQRGGGIDNFSGATLTIANSTVADNSNQGEGSNVQRGGGGIATSKGATLIIMNCTIAGNDTVVAGDLTTRGGGILIDGGNVTVRGTIFARNNGATGPDICGSLTSQGFNLVGSNADATITPAQSSDLIGTAGAPVDPLIGPLQDNGGPTFTRALQFDSPAVNAGDPNASARDQRGYVRTGVSDIGAFEFGATVPVSLGNISTRLRVETGNDALIGGFIVTGLYPKKIIVRGIGPSLPLTGALVDPTLELRDSSGALIQSNDNWRSNQESEIIATTLAPSNDLESAIVTTLPANNEAYTAIVRGVNNTTGIGLVEVYDLNRTVDSTLGNISTRGLVQEGDNVLIGGLIVQGQDSIRVMVRAIGPSLPVSGALGDPTLELHDGDGALFASNDNWRTDQEAEIIATGIAPSNDLESAIVLTLTPGDYTAIVRGANDTTGVGLVEAYSIN